MVTIKQIESGTARYLDEKVMPMLPQNGAKKVLIGSALTIMVKRIGNLAGHLNDIPMLQSLGVVTEDTIDIESYLDEVAKQLGDETVTLQFLGLDMKFNKNDVRELKAYICKEVE